MTVAFDQSRTINRVSDESGSYTYTQYLDSFEEIYNLLSKESVLKGSFDKFAESERQKRGTTEVDAEFLKEIESWREALAKDIAMRNPKLSVRELNFCCSAHH